jgi:hypothetical protein
MDNRGLILGKSTYFNLPHHFQTGYKADPVFLPMSSSKIHEAAHLFPRMLRLGMSGAIPLLLSVFMAWYEIKHRNSITKL